MFSPNIMNSNQIIKDIWKAAIGIGKILKSRFLEDAFRDV